MKFCDVCVRCGERDVHCAPSGDELMCFACTAKERDEAQRLILAYAENATTENAGALWRYGRDIIAKGAKL